MNAQRGDVVLVMFPDSNLRTAKRRPALVVQSDQLQAGLPQTIVAMITSNMARAGHPSRQPVSAKSPAGQQMGLPNLFRNVFCIEALAKSITFAFNCQDFDSEEVGGRRKRDKSNKLGFAVVDSLFWSASGAKGGFESALFGGCLLT